MTWEEMTMRERDAWIAEHVMGRKWWKEDKGDYTLYYLWDFDPRYKFRDYKGEQVSGDEAWKHQGSWYRKSFPDYSTDIAAAFSMEDKIKERGLHVEYAVALCGIASKTFNQGMAFDYIHATAEQRCRAAYEVFNSL